MRFPVKLAVLVTVLLLLAPTPAPAASHHSVSSLTPADRRVAVTASMLAVKPHKSVAWARRQLAVQSVQVGRDGRTVVLQFRDGATITIVPRTEGRFGVRTGYPPTVHEDTLQVPPGTRAVVLEPFAALLGHSDTWGQTEADLLTSAGFQVDVLRNTQVTVAALEHLADYSLVYMETHSGLLPDGDAVIAVNETDLSKYMSMLDSGDGSVGQVLVAGDSTHTLYNAIKANFIKLHVGMFSNSSLLFLNGCAIINAPRFWSALRSRNASTLIGWDNDVAASDDEIAASSVMHSLVQGDTASQAVDQARAAGLGTSQVGASTAQLGLEGDGDNTLARVLAAATPTPTLTPIPSPTVTPKATPKPTAHVTHRKKHKSVRCKRGYHVVKGKCHKCKNGKCKTK